MKDYEATELAFKNGYRQGTEDALRKIKFMLELYVGTYINNDTVKILDMFKAINQFADEILEATKDGRATLENGERMSR